MSSIRLTPTSYIVLGFVSLLGEATPYDLKRMVSVSVGHFWSFPHSQLYAEPDRLAEAGYLTMNKENSGRRRKLYRLTANGRTALAEWTAAPVDEPAEIRDPATLKLFFGADPAALAKAELELFEAELSELERIKADEAARAPTGPALALDYGIQMLRAVIEFWTDVARSHDAQQDQRPSHGRPPDQKASVPGGTPQARSGRQTGVRRKRRARS